MKEKGFSQIILILGLLILLTVILVGIYFTSSKKDTNPDPGFEITQELNPSFSKFLKETPNSNSQHITKEQAIECVKKEAAKDVPDKKIKVVVDSENDSTWFTSVLEDTPEENLIGWYPVDKETCETSFATP